MLQDLIKTLVPSIGLWLLRYLVLGGVLALFTGQQNPVAVLLFAGGILLFELLKWIIFTLFDTITYGISKEQAARSIVTELHKVDFKIPKTWSGNNAMTVYSWVYDHSKSEPERLFAISAFLNGEFLRLNGAFLKMSRYSSLHDSALRMYEHETVRDRKKGTKSQK